MSLFSSGLWELAILDNTVARHTVAVFDQVPSTLVAGAAGSLFGVSSQAQFLTGAISATGVTSTVFATLLQTLPRQLVYRDNRVYTNAGEIVDVTSPAHPAVFDTKWHETWGIRDIRSEYSRTTEQMKGAFPGLASLPTEDASVRRWAPSE